MPVGQVTPTVQTYSCTIVTSDPVSGIIEVIMPGNLENVTVVSTPVAFRWPVAGETWRIEKVNGLFYLREPYPVKNPGTNASVSTTAANTINTVAPGDAVINSPTGKIWVMGSATGATDFSFNESSLPHPPTTWTGLPYASSWQDYSAPTWQAGQYCLDQMGFVHLRGLIARTIPYVIGQAITTLPAGYRPAAYEMFTCYADDGAGGSMSTRIDVMPTGVITISTSIPTYSPLGTMGWLSLSGITFAQAN